MIEWSKREGRSVSYHYEHNGKQASVWQVGGSGWWWHVFDNATGVYTAAANDRVGTPAKSLDGACEDALKAMAL